MDVKGAKALSERLTEAARNDDPPPRKRRAQQTPTEGQRSPTLRRRGNRGVRYTFSTVDSGIGGNFWANDTITRQLQIWKVAAGYCASVSDQGSFVKVEGASPGNTGTVSAGITGKLKGGYTTTLLRGTLDSNKPTRGNLGNFTADSRPSFASYGLSGDLADWGWVYQTENNGTWINASIPPGNNGDITG